MKKILFIIIAGLISLSVDAQKWYVATTGDDANGDGSITYPWKTVKHAADTITGANGFSGDTIVIGAGTYSESAITLSDSISIIGQQVSPLTSIITAATGITIIEASSTAGDAINGNQSISYVKFDGNLTALRAVRANYRSEVLVHHCTFDDFLYQALWFWGSTSAYNITPTNTIPSGIKIYNNIFTNNTQYTGNSDAGHIVWHAQRDMEIYNNTFDQTDRASGDNATILNGSQYYNLKIHDNTFTKPDNNGSAWNFFYEAHYCHGGLEVYDNDFIGTACFDLSGVIIGEYDFGAKIYGNTFTTSAATPLVGHAEAYLALESFVELNDVYVYHNYFKFGRTCIAMGSTGTETNGVYIYYNVMDSIGNTDDNWGHGVNISSAQSAVAKPVKNVFIENNVITSSIATYGGITMGLTGDMTNINIQNNIINGLFSRPIRTYRVGGTPNLITANFKNNILYGNSGDEIYLGTNITYSNVDTTGNLTSNPLFVGTGTPPLNYKLQSGSPAKDAGISVGLTKDYGGYNVPVGPLPDIGAWEYGADVTPPNWHPTGLGWDDIYFKNNFRDTVNFTVPPTIAGAPLDLAALLPSGLTATVNDLNATAGATGNFQGQINALGTSSNDAKADTSLSNLSSVAINSNLLPNAAGTIDLGSATYPFDDLHLDTASQVNFHNGDITATHSDGTLTFAGGNIVLPNTTSIGSVSATEIGYVNGVTSTIQTQLNLKADTAGAIDIEEFLLFDASTDTLATRAYARSEGGGGLTSGEVATQINDTIVARLSAAVAGIRVADTAAMLTPYMNRADTATMLINYILESEVATDYIATTDTSDMLEPYFTESEIRKADSDTIPIFVFGAGSGGVEADTALFTATNIYGAFYNDKDTIIATSLRAVLIAGTTPLGTDTIAIQVFWNDTINAVFAPTARLNTNYLPITSVTLGTEDTSFNTSTIPPGVWVFCKSTAGTTGRKPKALYVTLYGFKRNRTY